MYGVAYTRKGRWKECLHAPHAHLRKRERRLTARRPQVFGLGFLRSVASREAHVHFTTAMLHWYQVRGWVGAHRGGRCRLAARAVGGARRRTMTELQLVRSVDGEGAAVRSALGVAHGLVAARVLS